MARVDLVTAKRFGLRPRGGAHGLGLAERKFGARNLKGERILLSRPGPILDYWDGED